MILWAIVLQASLVSAQTTIEQSLIGTVRDDVTSISLKGATVSVIGSDLGAVTDEKGQFRITLSTGRYSLFVSHVGYEGKVIQEVLISASKETVLDINLVNSPTQLEEIVIEGRPELTEIGNRDITIEQTLRYAATFYDPARLVESLPAASNVNDQNNNISVRGVSPTWNQWYLEGVEIANPNHLSNAGTLSDRPTQNGGGVNILSAQMLSTSSFKYQNYGVDYGNALGGIFDMRLRNGSNLEPSFTAQASLLGFDFAAETPVGDKGASILANYRYSFTGLLAGMGVDFGGESIGFQDLAINFYKPYDGGYLKIFGMGGLSYNNFNALDSLVDVEEEKQLYDIDYIGKMLALGISNKVALNSKTSVTSTMVLSLNHSIREQRRMLALSETSERGTRYRMLNNKLSGKLFLANQLTNRLNFRVGMSFTLSDPSIRQTNILDIAPIINQDFNETLLLVQPFMNSNWWISNALLADIGVRTTYYTDNEELYFLPRGKLTYFLDENNSISIASGRFAQVAPLEVLLAVFDNGNELITSINNSISYSISMRKAVLDAEIFFNQYDQVPILPDFSGDFNQNFSTFNQDEFYDLTALTPIGKAIVYGVQMNYEQTLTKDWYYLIGGTYYQSSYEANGDKTDSRWNGEYGCNATIGREFQLRTKKEKHRSFNANARVIYQGGFLENPIDESLSNTAKRIIYDYSDPYSVKTDDYFRLDLRFSWRVEKPGYTRTLSIDLQNATNQQNYASRYFDEITDQIETRYQLGLIPLLTYRVEF